MRTDGCLTDEDLAELDAGAVDEARLDGFVAHLDGCPLCRERWGAFAAEPAGAERSAAPVPAGPIAEAALRAYLPVRRLRIRRVAMAAAAALVLGFALPFLFRSESPEIPGVARLPEGRPVRGLDEVLETADAAEALRLPDGSRLRLLPGSRARFLVPGPGERCHLRIERGTLEAEVEPSKRLFRVSADAGEIRVVGTRFTARAFRIFPPGSRAGTPYLSVEVFHGAVDLSGGKGIQRVESGRRGVIRELSAPILQDIRAIPWEEAVRRWGRYLETAQGAEASTTVALLSGTWKGFSTWSEALADRGSPGEARRAAAALVSVSAEPGDEPRLWRLWDACDDPAARRSILRALARLGTGDLAAGLAAIDESRTPEDLERLAERWREGKAPDGPE